MGQRPQAHRLGEKAVRLFKSKMPDAWVCRDQDPDYGADLEIEVGNSSEDLTGEVLKVQVKGHQHLRFRRGLTSGRIKASTTRYWMRLRMPIILASVDISTGKIYWVDAAKVLRRLPWTALQKSRISVPITEASAWGTQHSFERLVSKILYDYDWRATAREFDTTLDRLPELLRVAAWVDRCDSWMPMEERDARRWRELRRLAIRLAGAAEIPLPAIRSIKDLKDAAVARGYEPRMELPYGDAAQAVWEILPILFRALIAHQQAIIEVERSFWIAVAYERFERWFAEEFPDPESREEVQRFTFEHE